MYGFDKKAVWIGTGSKYINAVNDAVVGGQIQSLPAIVVISQGEQTLPGDRIVMDDATALLLSQTSVGTLWGGVYQYVQVISTATAAPAVGGLAFLLAANIGSASVPYQISSDAQPAVATPGYFAGVFINALTKGNYGWIQVAGIANVLFDSALTATSVAATVSAKVSAAVASTADAGVALTTVTNAWVFGVAIGTPATSTLSKVLITRAITRY